jgi:hypothetical protein
MVDFTSTQAQAKELPLHLTEEGPRLRPPRKNPQDIASVHHRWGGHDVPSTGRNPCHRRRAASGVCSLASD